MDSLFVMAMRAFTHSNSPSFEHIHNITISRSRLGEASGHGRRRPALIKGAQDPRAAVLVLALELS
jgi:hypothetical protein